MFDIGFQELIIIFIVALIVFGPKKLPEISRTLGKWVVEIRRGIHNAKVQMETEFENLEKNSVRPDASKSSAQDGHPGKTHTGEETVAEKQNGGEVKE